MSVPSLPTPPLPDAHRSVVYGVWSWTGLVLAATVTGWEVIETAPRVLYAVLVGWTFLGSGAGFMARNNIT